MEPTESIPSFELYRAKVVHYEDAPDECTICPKFIPEGRTTTSWITAREGSFCSVQSRR